MYDDDDADDALGADPLSTRFYTPSSSTGSPRPQYATVVPDQTDLDEEIEQTPRYQMLNTSLAVPALKSSPARSPPPPSQAKQVRLSAKGDEYVGEAIFAGDKQRPHGQGSLYSASGCHTYIGDFVNGALDGNGKLMTPRYVLYSRWKSDKPDFTFGARVDYSEGDRYFGFVTAYRTAKPSAKAVQTSAFFSYFDNHDLYRTRWGEMVWRDKTRYFGHWERNERHGFGIYLLQNGDRYIGGWSEGLYHGNGVLFTAKGPIYDGIWTNGVFTPGVPVKRGFVPQPDHLGSLIVASCGVKLVGAWRSVTEVISATMERLPVFRGDTEQHQYAVTSSWTPLLCGRSATSKLKDAERFVPFKQQLTAASTKEQFCSVLCTVMDDVRSFENAFKVFERAFFFCYGCCGVSSEIGSGLGNSPLGWCHGRLGHAGGCYHHGRGTPIEQHHVAAAVGDLISLVFAAKEYLSDLYGYEELVSHMEALDAESAVNRTILDCAMRNVHPVLLNLYIQVYNTQQSDIDCALHQLSKVTPDDLGVVFARGSDTDGKLFVPYSDAINSLKELTRASTLSDALACLRRWSREIDLGTKAAQLQLHYGGLSPGQNHGAPQSGSADDLLPIHQYVMIKAAVPHLYAHTRLLIDFASGDQFVDATSQDAFCSTTLRACVSILPELRLDVRDAHNIVTPVSVFEKRVEDALDFVERDLLRLIVRPLAGVLELFAVDQLCEIPGELKVLIPPPTYRLDPDFAIPDDPRALPLMDSVCTMLLLDLYVVGFEDERGAVTLKVPLREFSKPQHSDIVCTIGLVRRPTTLETFVYHDLSLFILATYGFL